MSKLFRRLFLLISFPHFLAGLRAEEVFEKQALENSWIVERIPQDRMSFKKGLDNFRVGFLSVE